MLNKKGVSVMVAYVMLIVIAVGLSVGVFNFLRLYVPKEKVECPSDISLIVQSTTCVVEAGDRIVLDVTIKNKGLFSVPSAYIRLAPEKRKIREWINKGDDFYYDKDDKKKGLPPGKEWVFNRDEGTELITRSVGIDSEGKYTLEVQPAIYSIDGPIACEKSVITQPITCS